MNGKDIFKSAKDIFIGVAIMMLGAMALKYADIPSRVSVLESQFKGIDQKLDILISRN